MSKHDRSTTKSFHAGLVFCSVALGACATNHCPDNEFIEAENKIVAKLADLKSGQSLFGVFEDVGLKENTLNSKVIVAPLKPIAVVSLGYSNTWIKLKIEFDRPLYQLEFSNVALGKNPHNYTKSGPFVPPKVKNLEIIYVDLTYKYLPNSAKILLEKWAQRE